MRRARRVFWRVKVVRRVRWGDLGGGIVGLCVRERVVREWVGRVNSSDGGA